MKPIIGINTNLIAGCPGEYPTSGVRTTYIDSVHAAGGIPVLLPPVLDASVIREQVAACEGFIFVGGPDINPARYGHSEVNPTVTLLPERRETYDFMLIEEVLQTRKPFLGICLGCQEVNVALGGTLIQDIQCSVTSTIQHSLKLSPHYARQTVQVEPGTTMAEITGGGELQANSAHHQAIDQPGRGLRVSSRCREDGIIESMELENYGFGLAVQWHPEVLALEEKPHLQIFEALIAAAVEHSQAMYSVR
jgi:putative glutamine amidotransferase